MHIQQGKNVIFQYAERSFGSSFFVAYVQFLFYMCLDT